MQKLDSEEVAKIFNGYPKSMQEKLVFLRQLIVETSAEMEGGPALVETLKWGEPSYLTKGGSTIRIAWKKSNPHRYAMYFNCKTRLIETFKALYGNAFQFEGNRAIVFDENDEIPIEELKHCIYLSLSYHRRKHLPMLGV